MRRSAGIVTAACALGASAIVLPPGLDRLSTVIITEQTSQNLVVALPCSQCAFSKSNLGDNDESSESIDNIFSIQGGSYNVLLNYTISEDSRSFGYAGRTMVPLKVADLKGPAYVSQVPSAASIADVEAGLAATVPVEVTMDYWWSLEGSNLDSSEEGPMEIGHYIVGLNGQTVSLSEVKIHLLRDAEGRLQIEGSQIGASRDQLMTAPWREDDGESFVLVPLPEEGVEDVPSFDQGLEASNQEHDECKMPASLCRLKALLMSKIDADRRGGCRRKGPGRHLPTHIKPHFTRPGHDEIPRPQHGRPQYHHKRPHHRHRHSFMHTFARGVTAVLVPTLAGIAVGMTASLVGLIVGRLIGFLWIKLVRGGRRGNAGAIALTEECDETEPEKESLIAEMEAPPVYEDAVYHEEANVAVRDEK